LLALAPRLKYEGGFFMPKIGMSKLRRLTESAILIAIATILSLIKLYQAPAGGEVTLGAMIPLLIISYRHGIKWGVLAGTVYGLIQMIILGFFGLAGSILDFAIVIFLDYILAFAVIGLADWFRKPFKNKYLGYIFSTGIVMILRFLFHFVSGAIIWAAIWADGTNPWLYSLGYNTIILIEAALSTVIIVILVRYIKFEEI